MVFTGRRRYRLEGNLLVLQLEYHEDHAYYSQLYSGNNIKWKDATIEDITTKEINHQKA